MRLIALLIFACCLPLFAGVCLFLAAMYPLMLVADKWRERRERKAWSMPVARGATFVLSGELLGVN